MRQRMRSTITDTTKSKSLNQPRPALPILHQLAPVLLLLALLVAFALCVLPCQRRLRWTVFKTLTQPTRPHQKSENVFHGCSRPFADTGFTLIPFTHDVSPCLDLENCQGELIHVNSKTDYKQFEVRTGRILEISDEVLISYHWETSEIFKFFRPSPGANSGLNYCNRF